ncbi:protease inhibitor I42 family protein [Actinocrispum wychmicini]|uniref:Inhibitor of cysteine peptidase n=1 Tax=Actinocrispum wychmicini TaxID=1213861 RepID=A0A4R2IXS0_9PSEU|nr:protease inhibitor I42 family protein [Actinocrispum wychmicini]TCO49742.1 inhibitor of cysteine peptidase [Actinocrispum wychmicini]
MIAVRVGEVFNVDLKATPTTGYRWQPVDLPGVRLVDTGFTADGTTPGQGGTERFHLRAAEPGRHTLTFELKRAWETDPVDTRTVEIDVSEA